MSLGGVGQDLNRKYLQDRMADMLVQADEMQIDHRHDDPNVEPDGRDERDHAQHGRQRPAT